MNIADFQRKAPRRAFTLVDLVVLVAMVMVLSALAMPALGTSRERALDAMCLSNLGELARATHVFAASNDGWLPGNDGQRDAWAGIAQPQNHADPSYLANSTNSQLAPYLKGNVRVFQCPADTRRDQLYKGGLYKLSRNYSLNGAVGTFPILGPKAPVFGYWLNGGGGHTPNSVFYCYARISDMNKPSPNRLYWYVDEGNDSIYDETFQAVGPGVVFDLVDFPAERHNTGAGFVFGDGHGEIHRWSKPGIAGDGYQTGGPRGVATPQDQAWISAGTSARILP